MARPKSSSSSATFALVLAAVTLMASWSLTIGRESSSLMISSYGEKNGTETATVSTTAR